SQLQDRHRHTVSVRVTCGVTCSRQGYHRPPLDQTEMRGPSCQRQTLVPHQICNIFQICNICKWSTSIRKRLAHLCRKPGERESMISACITGSWTHCRPSSSGSAVLAGWNTRPLLSPRSCSSLRAATAASFNGTYGSFVLRPRDV